MNENTREALDLEKRKARWARTAQLGNPLINKDLIQTICEEIVRRAFAISTSSKLRAYDVSTFLLDRSEAWLMRGMPVTEIGRKIPRNLTELGVLKLSEGSDQVAGAPLTGGELKAVAKATKTIIH